jgi:hypothetical protein
MYAQKGGFDSDKLKKEKNPQAPKTPKFTRIIHRRT